MVKCVKRLRIVISILAFITMFAAVVYCCFKKKETQKKEIIAKCLDKNLYFVHLMDLWIDNKQNGREIANWLLNNGYKKIAIYGMGILGKRLLEELYDTRIDVKYGIDINADRINVDIDMLKPTSDMKSVDVVIITCYEDKDEVINMMRKTLNCPVLDIKYILERC